MTNNYFKEWILGIKRARSSVTLNNSLYGQSLKRNRVIQTRVNKFLKNIQEIKRLIEVRSAIRVLSKNLRNISLQVMDFKN